jgi:hypothetical protein
MKRAMTIFLLTAMQPFCAASAGAGEADVVSVEYEKRGEEYSFHVTVRHDDTGWEHYADRWEILSGDGEIIATRTLLHPHADEQPFRRSLTGVVLPAGTKTVTVRAHDKVDGYGGKVMKIDLEEGAGGT